MAKDQLQQTTELYEACHQDIINHRARQEELANHAQELAEELEAERQARGELDDAVQAARREWEDQSRKDRRELEKTESALKTAKHDLDLAKSLLAQRESDLAEVQEGLNKLETDHRRAGEHATSDKFSLNLELDRLRRDLARAEDELGRLRKELDDRETRWRDREGSMDKVHGENRDLAAQLAAQTQQRLNMSEKLDGVQARLNAAETELAAFRSKAGDLEAKLSKDQRNQLSMEHQYRDQLTERNTLLLTIYQYMDKILGVDKTPVRYPLFVRVERC